MAVHDVAPTARHQSHDYWRCHAELRGLAEESLQLLRAALYDARFPALFELPVFGAIIGMFELNNLGAVTFRTGHCSWPGTLA